MSKRKVFSKTDLNIPEIAYSRDVAGRVTITPEEIPPIETLVVFDRNPSSVRSFDFIKWYGSKIDSITYACQRQIERYLAGQDGHITSSTIISYCRGGIAHFLDYLLLCANTINRELTLNDLNRSMIDGFLNHLTGKSWSTVSQRAFYSGVKSVLTALGRRGLIVIISAGDNSTFPFNPFPNSNQKSKGETALPKAQRQAFAAALKQSLLPIWQDGVELTLDLVAYSMLTVALHTGRNTTPLLEATRDCLHPHPKNKTKFLLLWKRRGHNSSKVALRTEDRAERTLESTPTVKFTIESLIKRVLALSEALIEDASEDLKDRVWLYRIKSGRAGGKVSALTEGSLAKAIQKLIIKHGLTDTDGHALRVNISRLRKTFANRIYELLGSDLLATAAALGSTPEVTGKHYLASNESSIRNWRFMGEILVKELLSRTLGETFYPTPMGLCSDPENGQYAPKEAGSMCFSFANCLRCKHFAITEDDLYKLFSFYFRVLAEHARMDKRRWAKEYSSIPRLIDRYIVAEGLRRGIFKKKAVEAARKRARIDPHPFWTADMIELLETFS
ncbi:hypothetical protein HDC30_004894 [Pseudomonas sp. JAI115]|uniref:hypothetical protein n=1 Tax=Pseudomonas sp. JAI115 TaxID=2723061 RepID=UPI00161B8CA5|nr:hypothetical protein [Pseudomonas sp. JAI115]MBB6157643.1 hypothetical protein [Pseudomonas sp. JAI115]